MHNSRNALPSLGILALLIALSGCGEEDPSDNPASSTFDTPVATSGETWSSTRSGEVEGTSWEIQMRRRDGGVVCARLVTDPSRIDWDAIEGICLSEQALFSDGVVKAGGTVIGASERVLAGGVVAADVESLVFVSTDGQDFPVEVEAGAWILELPSSTTLSAVMIDRGESAEVCEVLPEASLVLAQVVCRAR